MALLGLSQTAERQRRAASAGGFSSVSHACVPRAIFLFGRTWSKVGLGLGRGGKCGLRGVGGGGGGEGGGGGGGGGGLDLDLDSVDLGWAT